MKKYSKIDQLIKSALREDIADCDVTTNALIDKNSISQAVIFSKEDAVLSGLELTKRVFQILDPKATVRFLALDGQRIKPKKNILIIKGKTRALLTGERVALNFLSYLSAIATKTNTFVNKIKPYKTRILDTRKTTPTLRFLERYAVRCGGGFNHRDNLNEMAMIKDNHLAAINSDNKIVTAVGLIRQKYITSVEVEVDTLEQLIPALESSAEIILLDNMSTTMIRRAVGLRNKIRKSVLLEASGGINLSNVKQYAQTGVDRISIGGLTHSRDAIDFSMEIIK